MKVKPLMCLFLCAIGSSAWADLSDGLVAYYPFNGNANDQSGHEGHGIVYGAKLTSDQNGNENSAYEFDGIDDYIDFGSVLPDSDTMTMSIWLFAPGPDYAAGVFSDTINVSLKVHSDHQINIVITTSFGARLGHVFDLHESLQSNKKLSITNRWRHVVLVMTRNSYVVYVDGVARLSIPEGGSNVGAHHLRVGCADPTQGDFWQDDPYWKGKISSLRFYDRVLDETEIVALYEADDPGGVTDGHRKPLLYVDDDAAADPGPFDLTLSDPDENGTVDHPYDSIQEAIDAADDGHKIVVRSGTYIETIDFLGKRIEVTGLDPNAAASVNQPCPIIDGNYQDTVVTFANGEDPNARLSHFTITRGFGRYGGGILCIDSEPTVANCLITGNRSGGYFGGGAVYATNSDARFEHCTLTGNYGGPAGAGFYSENSANAITGCILWDNLPADLWAATFGPGAEPPSITYSLFSSEEPGVGNLTGDPRFAAPGHWALASDPDVTTDPAHPQAIWVTGDYHLLAESPCIDAGDPDWPVDANDMDLDGQTRVMNGRGDMGSDEYPLAEHNFTALCHDMTMSLIQDANALDPEHTYTGRTTFLLDAYFAARLVAQASAASEAGGHWTVTVSPNMISPALGVMVELTVQGTGVDVGKLPHAAGDTVLVEVTLTWDFSP